MEFLSEYAMFLLQTLTMVAAILVILTSVLSMAAKNKTPGKKRLQITKLNQKFEEMKKTMYESLLPKTLYKEFAKSEKVKHKKEAKEAKKETQLKNKEKKKVDKHKKRVFVLNFHGDIKASAVSSLSDEITALLTVATKKDEIVIRLESGGGLVSAYGLGASQLERIKSAGIPLTVCVDKVAASGGYLMGCVADKVYAARFAIVGSIGVIGQVPNFNKLLTKHGIEYEQHTAGKFKRTLTMFGENTDKDRKKFVEDLEDIHELFSKFITKYRPDVDLKKVTTGEYWFADKSKELLLIDDISTSDDYISKMAQSYDVFEVKYLEKKGLAKRMGGFMEAAISAFQQATRTEKDLIH